MNVGLHVGDDARAVEYNRATLRAALQLPILFLNQVHGVDVLHAQSNHLHHLDTSSLSFDAAWTEETNLGLAVQTADCLPVLFASTHPQRRAVGVAHAGWRGLCQGVLEATVTQMCAAMALPPASLRAWLGPCIGPTAFEVDVAVRDAFVDAAPHDAMFFCPLENMVLTENSVQNTAPKWLADLKGLAARRLRDLGLTQLSIDPGCTFSQPERFFSFRRDGRTGRMASVIAIVGAS
jgi:YfiH family protein